MIAVGERKTETRRRPQRGGDAGNNLDVDTCGQQHVELFAATPENERVATLQTNDKFPGERLVYQQPADIVLR